MIELDVARGVLRVLVDDDELARRLEALPPRVQKSPSGYQRLFVDHVMQADRGVDFDFLVGRRGTEVHGDNH